MDNKIKILIVEDEAIIAENLRYCLEDLGYEVTDTCYGYSQTLLSLKNGAVDLVLLDINLGSGNADQDGLSLAGIINEEYKIPFIFLTAYNDLETIKTATRLQPAGYLIKPVNNASLFAAIQTAIERFNNNITAGNPNNNMDKPDYFFVKLGTKTHKVLWNHVYCIEAGKNYVKLRSTVTGQDYPIRGSLTYVLENLLPAKFENHFIRINRSTSINKNFITAYDNNYVYCGKEIFENGRISTKQLEQLIIK